MKKQTEDIEQAASAAEQAAASAETAAETAAAKADAASASALEAREIADTIATLASSVGGPSDFIYLLSIFVLAVFVGYYVVWSVTPALHTPLMSVTNAISSVVIVGALLSLGADLTDIGGGFWPKLFGFLGVVLASVNIFGGFLVTQRMLAMYKKKGS